MNLFEKIVDLMEDAVSALSPRNNAEFQQALFNLIAALREVRRYL